jgi:hypothetical protein
MAEKLVLRLSTWKEGSAGLPSRSEEKAIVASH